MRHGPAGLEPSVDAVGETPDCPELSVIAPMNAKAIVTLIVADAARFSLFSSCSLGAGPRPTPFDETLKRQLSFVVTC
jgi:hypothetical protein